MFVVLVIFLNTSGYLYFFWLQKYGVLVYYRTTDSVDPLVAVLRVLLSVLDGPSPFPMPYCPSDLSSTRTPNSFDVHFFCCHDLVHDWCRHVILYNSSASVNLQYIGFHKILKTFSLFHMTFHVIYSLNH